MEKNLYNLTNPQKSIWLTEQYYPNSNINNVCGVMSISQAIDFDALKKAINLFVKSNDIFRSKYVLDNDELKWYVDEYNAFDISTIEVGSKSDLDDLAKSEVSTAFDFFDNYLFKFTLFKFPNQNGGFVINTHHIISDSWTLGILGNEIISYYSSIMKNEQLNIKDSCEFSYINYITSEQEYKSSDKYEKDRVYWNNKFSTVPEVAFIPSTIKSDSESSSINANRKAFSINSDLLNKLKVFCSSQKISLFNFFMAIYAIYLGRVSNLDDFCIGTPILNRTNYKEKHTAGMFINSLPLRININNDISFIEFASIIAQDSMQLLRHQKYGYQAIIEDIRKRESQTPSLYTMMLSYQVTKIVDNQEATPHHSEWIFDYTMADDIDIHILDLNDENNLNILYDYRLSKYTDADMASIHSRIEYMISQILSSNSIKLGEIEIITPDERTTLFSFNPEKTNYPSKTVYELFRDQVNETPDNIAVVFEDKALTYKELDEKVNQLAHYLSSNGVGYNDIVCLLFDKSLEVVISILATLKCNAIYLPIDIDYPADRISYILSDSSSKVLLLDPNFGQKVEDIDIDKLEISLKNNNIFNIDFSNFSLPIQKNNEDLAYIMYTSGSTGNPKGSMIKEKSIVRLVINTNYIDIKPEDRIIQTGSIVFDACTFELWGAFLNGASVYLILKQDLLNPEKLKNYLINNNITIMFITTALFNQFADIDAKIYAPLNYLLTGGEAVSINHMRKVRELNPNLHLIHCYGPTENTTFSTYYDVTHIDSQDVTVPIGASISNSTCYVVSPTCGLLQPINTPGELWVGGDGVGKGYLNRPELTNSQFIANPFEPGTIYKTGDLVEWLPSGAISFIGRIDNQVKIRGFRIELNEIDIKILSYPDIKQSITIIQTINDKKYICSYFVASELVNADDLKDFLKSSLPHYMVPHYIMQLDSMPMNINAKIDRKKLPIPQVNAVKKDIIAPRNSLEKDLYNILSELLNQREISVTDDFVNDLEMDSLSIMSFSTKLSKYNVEIQDISNFPSIEKLATRIENNSQEASYSSHIIEDVTIPNQLFSFDLTSVLITGSNGFLGCHLLRELVINNNVKSIYCLIRNKENINPKERLRETAKYFFNQQEQELCYKKVIVIDGNFEKDNLSLSDHDYNTLCSSITTVIHCGANVKHYGKYEEFYNSNVLGTINMIKFCKKSGAKLAHISTLSVGGYSQLDSSNILDENSINVGQDFKNHVYMITKYQAECEVLKAIANKEIQAKIFRLGNIMPRFSDGLFQKNVLSNAFISRLNTFFTIKCVPEGIDNLKIDISPVDLCAKSIILLLNDTNNQTIYHIFNNNVVSVNELLKILDIQMNIVPAQTCIEKIQSLNNPLHAHLLNDLLNKDFTETYATNIRTIDILNKLDFSWNILDKNYLNYILKYI